MTETVLDRFLRYVVIDTQSDPASNAQPSTEKQKDLGRVLVSELLALGLTDEAQTAGAILGHNFQSSPFYQDAYGLLTKQGLPVEAKGDNWLATVYRQVIKGEWL